MRRLYMSMLESVKKGEEWEGRKNKAGKRRKVKEKMESEGRKNKAKKRRKIEEKNGMER